MKGRANVPADVWARVQRGADDECWPWTGARDRRGYGQMRVNYRQMHAHRYAFIVATGHDPGELCVLHMCDNPPCCNPAHLFLGTRADNNRDCREKWRHRHGESHHGAKLTEEAVRDIRARSAAGAFGTELAAEYGVTPTMISYVVRRMNWRHVA